MSRQDRIQRKARQRKIRKKSRLYHRKIDKRKYYGVGVEIQRYENLMREVIDFEAVEDLTKTLLPEDEAASEAVVTEGFIDKMLSRIDGSRELFDRAVIGQLGDILTNSFEKGSKRAMTAQGDDLDVPEVDQSRAMDELLRDQQKYFENMGEDARQRMRDSLEDALQQGKSIDDATSELKDELDEFSRHRAETTARSEVIKASSRGTDEAFRQAGVEEVIWLATLDDRTCETCRDLHESKWGMDDPDRPMPVEDTHPNCRCTMVADTR